MELKKAKEILNTHNENNYSDEEIIQVLKFLNIIASVSINNLFKKMKNE